ncbi:MAG TPA: type II toxin-antitoxin system RelE/ParE family toxin [Thermoanaerobaculia bacterium]|nr:type II toxin-antitoxin system RelE/ParE family toxin [Thermoanaerobaculia bacterium]
MSYYDAKVAGLGDRFLAEIKSATRYVERYPEIAPVIEEGVRAKVLTRFPYTLMYVIAEDEIFILAVAHQSRRPAYWSDRLPQPPA